MKPVEKALFWAAGTVAVLSVPLLAGLFYFAGAPAGVTAAVAALPAVASALAAIAVVRLTGEYVRLTGEVATANRTLTELTKAQHERGEARIEIERTRVLLPHDPDRFYPAEQCDVQFTVINAGGHDTAIRGAFALLPGADGKKYEQIFYSIERIPRAGEDPSDWLVRAGDRVRFKAKVAVPEDTFIKTTYTVMPVLGPRATAAFQVMDEQEWEDENEREAEFALGL